MGKIKKEKIIVAVYIRIGNKENDDFAVRIQKALIDSYLKIKGNMKVVGYYIDYGYSGMNLNRPEIQKILKDMNCKKFHGVVVKELATISRNYLDLSDCIENHFKINNVKLISIADDIEFQRKIRKFYLLNNDKEVK